MSTDTRSARSEAGLRLRLDELVMDSGDPCALANFWAQALGYEVADCDNDMASIEDPIGTGPSMFFQRVPEAKSVKNRVHFDLSVDGDYLESAVAKLISLGATRVETERGVNRWWIVLADPEGNEFCVVP